MLDCLIPFNAEENPVPVIGVTPEGLDAVLSGQSETARGWADLQGYTAKGGTMLVLPGGDGSAEAVLFGVSAGGNPFEFGATATRLPKGLYSLNSGFDNPLEVCLGFGLSQYKYTRYSGSPSSETARLMLPDGAEATTLHAILAGVKLTRDLINTPANDLGPEELADAAVELFEAHGGGGEIIVGDDLLERNFPMIHAVGRASDRAPRLIDLSWGDPQDPKITLVGKGVIFDTGGLDIKPANAMLLMKKDMGGAANVLGLASMIMASELPVRLRVLIPAVENAISGSAFRPGDILPSRKGLSVEIGNTDAEGRLVLADALALADEEAPDLMIDMATLTGAARVALGPDLPPYYTDDDTFAGALQDAAEARHDPLWRLPLWQPYMKYLDSKIADINHINSTGGGFAGSITAALFLSRFVEQTPTWIHFDIYGWAPADKPGKVAGGDAQGIRALFSLLQDRYGEKK